ncbi:MAG: cadmium-translocating P-type ATPase [Nanoarchaeota archaeon]|nr:cadmium-translocating P-type ATPase [Nanoarchaeota archaeon]
MKNKMHEQGDKKCCSACATGVFEEKKSFWKQKDVKIILAAGLILSIGLYLEFLTEQRLVAQVLFFVVVIIAGRDIIKKGFFSLVKKRLNINFLITLAAIGAFLIGHGEEGAAVIFLFFIAEFLESYAAERARRSVASLLELAPETAVVKRHNKELRIHAHEVKVGDIMVVKPGDKIALDGAVTKGCSSVNQSSITGESMPAPKTKGDDVFAGTTNEDGFLEIRVTKKSDETTLSKIVKLVKEAQKNKSKTEVFIDKFARYYTPTVIILAFLIMIIPSLVFGLPFSEWFYKALVLLVISCPCALAMSTPVSMVSGLTSAAKNGVLIKGGDHVEEIRNAKVIVFDKTGTLTEGGPEVTDIIALNKYPEEELLRVAASLESKSRHPLAKAILRSAEKKGVKPKKVSEFKSFAGKGLKGRIGGRLFYIGNKNFFEGKDIEFPEGLVKTLESRGKTLVLVGNRKRVIGVISLMDKIRSVSFTTIKELKNRGIRTVMLTGDNNNVARAIATKLDIDEYYAELLPEDKVKIIDKLLKKHEHVVMIGDGVNDAPALAKAHVGIAMGTIGSDVAIEAADIALMQDDLSKIIYLLDLSKKTMRVVKQNVAISILIKSSFAILAFPGIITLWMAVAVGDMGLSLTVILNALRIGRKK